MPSAVLKALHALEREPVHDHCGVFAIRSKKPDSQLFQSGLNAAIMQQNRGRHSTGLVLIDNHQQSHRWTGLGDPTQAFDDTDRSAMAIPATTVMIHGRYATQGSQHPKNTQPIQGNWQGQEFHVIHNGQFSDEIKKPQELSDTRWFVQKIENEPAASLEDAIISVVGKSEGAFSLAIHTNDGLYAIRDGRGIRPLWWATHQDRVMIASETAALLRLGISEWQSVGRGEILKFSNTNTPTLINRIEKPGSFCAFESVYLSLAASQRPGSPVGLTNREIRKAQGRILADKELLKPYDIDAVIGIPGTGIPSGRAYASKLGVPYLYLVQDHIGNGNHRTFMMADINTIYQRAIDHFTINAAAVEGKSLVLIDDSLVRGNISRALTLVLKELGAKAVHWRICSPPIVKSCFLGIATKSKDELLYTHHPSIEHMRVHIGADSLEFLTARELADSIGVSMHQLCMGCMLGQRPPIDRFGNPTHQAILTP